MLGELGGARLIPATHNAKAGDSQKLKTYLGYRKN